eukprot:2085220-Alexandrium_andersonii.AAC.1
MVPHSCTSSFGSTRSWLTRCGGSSLKGRSPVLGASWPPSEPLGFPPRSALVSRFDAAKCGPTARSVMRAVPPP